MELNCIFKTSKPNQIMAQQDEERSPVFHERISILKKEGYRGFFIQNITDNKSGGVRISAKNAGDYIIAETGETNEEALKKIIEKIDLINEESA